MKKNLEKQDAIPLSEFLEELSSHFHSGRVESQKCNKNANPFIHSQQITDYLKRIANQDICVNESQQDFIKLLIKNDIRTNDNFEEVIQKIEFEFKISKKRKIGRKLKKIINKIEYHEHVSPT